MRDRLRTRKKGSSYFKTPATPPSNEQYDSSYNDGDHSIKDDSLIVGLDAPSTVATPLSQTYHTYTGRTTARQKEKHLKNVTCDTNKTPPPSPPPSPPWIPTYNNNSTLSPTSYYPSLCLSSSLSDGGKSLRTSGGCGKDRGILLEDIELTNEVTDEPTDRNEEESYRHNSNNRSVVLVEKFIVCNANRSLLSK